MTYSFFSWLLLLVLSASLVSWLSLGSSLVKISETHVFDLLKIVSLSLVFPHLGKITRILGAVGLGLIVGIPVGRTIEANARDNAITRLDGVEIIEQRAPRDFVFLKPDGSQEHGIFCESVPFYKGLRFKELTFKRKGFCWSVQDVKLGYHITLGETKHEGWNTDSHANAYPVAYSSSR